MSEPKLISPMLDNFVVGESISDCNGVRCYPAMENDSDDRYILKIISNPASQTQLDALLLTGAYPDAESANAYFKDMAEQICAEAEALQKLSGLEGFLPYEKWQIVPKENGEPGFDVYLLTHYKRTLLRQFRREPMTHLRAVNLGLDICAALSVCRRAGLLFVDLKPSNIYYTEEKGYHIGDLGFIRMDSLKYASLPSKYRSEYTAPELEDPFAPLNTTIDIYALGMILYQAYNNGVLPASVDVTLGEKPEPPRYADYEMAEIILKACDPDPEQRWQDPVEMGQAIVSYMQRNGANDVPIAPVVPSSVEDPIITTGVALSQIADSDAFDEELSEIEELIGDAEDIPADELNKHLSELDGQTEITGFTPEVPAADENAAASVEPEAQEQVPAAEGEAVEEETDAAAAEEDGEEDILANLSFLEPDGDETREELNDTQIDYSEITEEVSEILEQADDLAELSIPDPVVAPEAIEVPMPEPIVLEEPAAEPEGSDEPGAEPTPEAEAQVPQEELPESSEDESDDASQEASDDEKTEDAGEDEQGETAVPVVTEESAQEEDSGNEENIVEEIKPKKRKKHWIRNSLLIILLLALLTGGLYFYRHYFLQTIDSIEVTGDRGELTVTIQTKVDESMLSVVCTDPYGNKTKPCPVSNKTAYFTDLLPNTQYTVTVEISGFHKLIGTTSADYFSPKQTTIIQPSIVTGYEDGSAIINFTVDGNDSKEWVIEYAAEGEESKSVTIEGHTGNIYGMTLGKEYTIKLKPTEDLYLSGASEMTFTAGKIIPPKNPAVSSFKDGKLTVMWSVDEDVSVDGWTIWCYNDTNYNETITSETTSATFENIDHNSAYTVEIKANGQTVKDTAFVAKNALTIDTVDAKVHENGPISLTWTTEGEIPEGGWVLKYTISDDDTLYTAECNGNSAELKNAIPGQTYVIFIQGANGEAVVHPPIVCKTPENHDFTSNFGNVEVTKDHITLAMCKTPNLVYWNHYSVKEKDYTTTFPVGTKASFVSRIQDVVYAITDDEVTVLYVIYDSEGNLVSSAAEDRTWKNLWSYYYGTLSIPAMPTVPGEYTVYVYFNCGLVGQQDFTVTP